MTTFKSNKLRSTVVQDFQIKITVFEAKQLDGNNVAAICRVKCSKHTKNTKKIRSNHPYWNETFFYNFHISAAELFDQIIDFEVFSHARLARANQLIGKFSINIGYIYDEPRHSINRKWLLLIDNNNDALGVKGYLKVSIAVLGPGDEPPPEVRITSHLFSYK